MKADPPTRLRFEAFTLDLRRRGLYRGAERLHLTGKPFETLAYLVEHRHRVVSKQELLDAVWHETAVTEGVLVQAIREIRRRLGDDKDDPVFVLTVPREGYRFVAQVGPDDGPEAAGAGEASAPGRAESASSHRRLRTPFLVAAVAASVLLAVAAAYVPRWLGSRGGGLADGLSDAHRLTSGALSTVKPAFSPDGASILFAGDLPEARGALDLYLVPAAGGNPVRLTSNVEASGDLPAFTADGERVVFARLGLGADASRFPDLWSVARDGGTPMPYLARAAGAGFSPNGRLVAYTKYLEARRPLWVSPVDRLSEHQEAADVGFTPRWSPDGRWLAYTTSSPEGGLGDVWVVSRSLDRRRRLTRTAQQIYGLSWTADSRSIVYASSLTGTYHLFRVDVDGGTPRALTSGVGQYSAPSVSPDGATLAFTHLSEVRDLQVADDVAGALVALTTDEYHSAPRLSPSAGRVASIVKGSGRAGVLSVTDVATKSRVIEGRRPAAHPAWLDDGHVAYLSPSEADTRTELRVVDLVTGTDDPLLDLPRRAEWLAVAPGGDRVAVVVPGIGASSRVMVYPLTGSEAREVAHGDEIAYLEWSPDGRLLAWSGPAAWASGQGNGIWVADVGHGEPRRVVPDGFRPVWDSDQPTLYFGRILSVGTGSDAAGLWTCRLSDGHLNRVREWQHVDDFDVSAGRLLFTLSSGQARVYTVRLPR